jgi:hypothetical protein
VQVVIVIVAFALLAVVLLVVSAPLRAERPGRPPSGGGERDAPAELAELEAAREAKYREIRDAELDLHTGKLSRADYDAVAATLRSEAVAILDRLRELEGAGARSPGTDGSPGRQESAREPD